MDFRNLTPSQNYATIQASLSGTDQQVVCRPWDRVMSAENRRALEYLEIRGYYSTSYTQIVQPERIFAVTDYFRRYWVPLLKPGPAWLVVALRQRCFWNGQRDWCVVSRDTLARESGVAIRTADNYLDLPLIDWFVTGRQPRYSRTHEGAKRRDWTHYDLRLDEPLTPAHQAALAALAAEVAAACEATDPLARAVEIAQRLLDLPEKDLLHRLDQATKATGVINNWLSIQEIVEANANPESEIGPSAALTRLCDALYTRIVRPDKVQIATQYFRLRWLPLLGAARAWLILHLRARCYLSTQELEVRDIANVAGLAELSAALGVSISTVKTCLAEPPAATFLTHLATHRPAAGRVTMRFRVEMIDPLTPADLQRRAEMADLPGDEARVSSIDQQPDFAGSSSEQEPGFAVSPPTQEPESALSSGQETDFAGSVPNQESDSAGIDNPANSQILPDTRIHIITPDTMNTQRQQVLIPANREKEMLAAAAGPLDGVLTYLKIEEPSRSRILAANPPVATVLAWALEALTSTRLENRTGFLVSMLLSGYDPPPDLEQIVRLPVADWLVLARAARDTRTTGRAEIAPHLAPHFEVLYARLGRLAPSHWPILLPTPAAAPDMEPEDDLPEEEQVDESGEPDNPSSAEELRKSKIENPKSIWSAVLDDLRTQMDPSTFNAWLKGTEVVRVEGRCWTVAVRSQTAAGWLKHRLVPVIERSLRRVAGEPIEIAFEAEG